MANAMNTPAIRGTGKVLPVSQSAPPMGFGPGGPLPAPTQWTNYGSWILYLGGVVVGTPTGSNKGPGSINATSYYVNGVPFDVSNYLPLSGGVITGNLTVNGLFLAAGTVDGIVLDMGTF
jgi:hypothetical protein